MSVFNVGFSAKSIFSVVMIFLSIGISAANAADVVEESVVERSATFNVADEQTVGLEIDMKGSHGVFPAYTKPNSLLFSATVHTRSTTAGLASFLCIVGASSFSKVSKNELHYIVRGGNSGQFELPLYTFSYWPTPFVQEGNMENCLGTIDTALNSPQPDSTFVTYFDTVSGKIEPGNYSITLVAGLYAM